MKKCILITSHLNNERKINAAKSLLTYLSDKGMTIILIGNHAIPYEFQDMCSWVIYGDENPKFNRYYTAHSFIWFEKYNKTLKLSVNVDDHGFAHLLLMYRGFKFANDLGFDYVYHLNYDVKFMEDGWRILNDMIGDNNNVVKSWRNDQFGYETNFFCINLKEIISCFDNHLNEYLMNQYMCEPHFKIMLMKSNIKHHVLTSDDVYTSTCTSSNHRIYIDDLELEAFPYEKQDDIILVFNKPPHINSFHDNNGTEYKFEKTEIENTYIIKLDRDIEYLHDNKYVFSYNDLKNCYVED